MSSSKEVELMDSLLGAVKLFSERTTALERKVVDEMTLMRTEIQQLKQTIEADHNPVSLPVVMEQQRMTMIELIRQFQPLSLSNQPLVPQDPVNASVQQPVVEKPKTLVQEPVKQESKMPAQAPVVEKPKTLVQAPVVEKPKTLVQAPIAEKPKAPVVEKPKVPVQAPVVEKPKAPVQAPAIEKPAQFFFNAKPSAKSATPLQSQEQKHVTFSFDPNNSAKPLTNVEPTTESKDLFGKAADPQKPLFGGTASKTFSSFASNGNGSFLNNTGGSGGVSAADPKQFKLFGSTQTATADNGEAAGDDMAPEEFVPDDAQFKRPDIALPDLIEAKTGEEDEEVVFSARCRLYRFLPGNEVKERGTGDIKLLKARATGKIRCVMRREQVLKVCANFAVQSGFVINTTKRGDNVLTWACKDYSEDPNGESMTLICRFKDVATANQFKEITQSA